MAAIARNNAFGAGAPSWNLSFPTGDLTAAEIAAYCPHWLKSIDVINRFLSHGARTIHIAALLNEFRALPDDRVFSTNSTLVMMSYAMRKAGFDGWTVMKHFDFSHEHFLPESGLSVTNFRTPCMTQPRDENSGESYRATNQEVCPVPFKDLAKHVKKHPSGDDALDLSRCVQYAVEHPEEVWLFPTDLQRLTAHLGGPATITTAHLDDQVFSRRDDVRLPTTKRKRSAAIKPISANKHLAKQSTNKQSTGPRRFINFLPQSCPSQPYRRKNEHLSTKNTKLAEELEAGCEKNEPFGQPAKRRKLSRGRATYNSHLDDDEFIPEEYSGAPEQDEQTQNEVDRSTALRKARDGKRVAVESDTHSQKPSFALIHNQQLGIPSAFPSNSVEKLVFPSVYDRWSSFAPSNTQQSDFSPGQSQHLDSTTNLTQTSKFAPTCNPPQPSLAPSSGAPQSNFSPNDSSQGPEVASSYGQEPFNVPSNNDFPLSNPALDFDQNLLSSAILFDPNTLSSAPTSDQIPLDFDPTFNPIPYSSAPAMDQIPLDFDSSFDQKPSDFDPAPVTQQLELANLAQPCTQPYVQPYAQLDAAADAILSADAATRYDPGFLTPPHLPANRLQITAQNLDRYALSPFGSQSDMWTTAYHYKRFGGARESAPYRELHNLVCLDEDDVGDWAENIRFAKEQWLCYETVWTEFEGHLDTLSKARHAWGWKSLEAVRAEATPGSTAT